MDRRDLLVIVPTRGRPQNAVDLVRAWASTTTNAGTCDLLFVTDDDDAAEYPIFHGDNVRHEVGPRLRLGPTLNAVAVREASRYFALGFMGDDHRPRTDGWNERVIAELHAMRVGIAYGNDLIQGENLPTAVFMTSNIVIELGYFCLPDAKHLFLDNQWKTLGQMTGTLKYLPDVVIEHVHPLAGKAKSDAGYVECNAPEIWEHDEACYQRWMLSSAAVDAGKVIALKMGA